MRNLILYLYLVPLFASPPPPLLTTTLQLWGVKANLPQPYMPKTCPQATHIVMAEQIEEHLSVGRKFSAVAEHT